MKTKKIITWALMMLGFAGTMTITSAALAQTNMKWCTTWKSQYVDAGNGEDVYILKGDVYRSAAYGRASIHGRNSEYSAWFPVWEGYLDSSGCTPYLPVSFNFFRLTQSTYAQQVGNRTIWINAPNTEWGTNWVNLWVTYNATGLGPGNHTHTFNPNWSSGAANLMPIVRQLLRWFSTLDYRANTDTYIRYSHDDCYEAWYESGGTGKNVCISEGSQTYNQDYTAWKFVTAHELGHRVGYAANGFKHDANYGWSGAPYMCGCSFISGMLNAHCLTSRNDINVGQGEGFGYFYSAAMFNHRTWMDGVFVYPKPAFMVPNPAGPNYGTHYVAPPGAVFDAFVVNKTANTHYFDRWMQRRCAPPSHDANKGVELDWTKFLYDVWTINAPYRINVNQLQNIWIASPSPNWNIIDDYAEDALSGEQYLSFYYYAGTAGVRYYTN